MSLLSFFIMNGGAFAANIRYALFLRSPFVEADLARGEILEVEPIIAEEGPTVARERSGSRILVAQEYELIIPKISVQVPIVPPRSGSKEAILASMEGGVALYPSSDGIGTPSGRSILLGHSSRASWYRGDYATIFSLLPKLEVFDEFYVVGKGKKYVYQVFARKILSPSDANALLSGYASGSELDLITCYPIGSASKRNIVQASLVRVEEI
ncbi:MAG: sortase [Patescibacteria group bacterium]